MRCLILVTLALKHNKDRLEGLESHLKAEY